MTMHFCGCVAASGVPNTFALGPGNVSCWWSVSSELGFDYLTFYIDGVALPGAISGEVPWTQTSWNVPAGIHTLKWDYSKDGSVVNGADAAKPTAATEPIPMTTTRTAS